MIPIFQCSRSRYEPFKSWETLNSINLIDGIKKRSHGVEPEFACTFEKGRSKILDGVIVDLNSWPVNVALTRVKTRQDLRLLPTLPGQSLDHLYCLRPESVTRSSHAGLEGRLWS